MGLANRRGSWVECRGRVKSRGSREKSRGSRIRNRGSQEKVVGSKQNISVYLPFFFWNFFLRLPQMYVERILKPVVDIGRSVYKYF